MNRDQALEDFNKNIVENLLNECKSKFKKNLELYDEKIGKLIISSIKDLNKKVIDLRETDEGYTLSVLQFEILRTNILNESYKIWLHGYNKLWYLDDKSLYVEIDLKFLFEPFIQLKKVLINEKNIYMGKVNIYDIQNIIFDLAIECYNSMSETSRSYLWDLDEEEWIKDMKFSDFYIFKWSEYKGDSETVFAMDNREKTADELLELKNKEPKKLPFVYSIWRNSSFKDIDLSGENMLFINFKESSLENINFSNSEIIRGEFKRTKINQCNFRVSNIVGTTFKNSKIYKCDFEKCDLRGSDFEDSKLRKIIFKGSNLTGGYFENSDFADVSFENANLSNANFSNAKFKDVDFKDAILKNAIFSEQDVPFIHLTPEQLQDIYIESSEK